MMILDKTCQCFSSQKIIAMVGNKLNYTISGHIKFSYPFYVFRVQDTATFSLWILYQSINNILMRFLSNGHTTARCPVKFVNILRVFSWLIIISVKAGSKLNKHYWPITFNINILNGNPFLVLTMCFQDTLRIGLYSAGPDTHRHFLLCDSG